MKKALAIGLAAAMAVSMTAPVYASDDSESGAGIAKEDIKIGAIYIGDENEGYTAAHMAGIFLKVEACPAVCVFNFHCYGRAYALSSKVEGSVSGNNLCVRECTYITHFAVILCNSAVLDHLIQFQTCYYTGYITCFINICEVVVHVGKSA